jgi:anti-sigma factor (TIGR02949 family)
MNNATITCEDAIRLIASYIDRELNEPEAVQLRAHIDRCKSCYSRVEFEQQLKAQLATLRSVPVSDELGGRIRVLLQGYGNE